MNTALIPYIINKASKLSKKIKIVSINLENIRFQILTLDLLLIKIFSNQTVFVSY